MEAQALERRGLGVPDGRLDLATRSCQMARAFRPRPRAHSDRLLARRVQQAGFHDHMHSLAAHQTSRRKQPHQFPWADRPPGVSPADTKCTEDQLAGACATFAMG